MDRVLGTCSLCGGAVTLPWRWMDRAVPPVPTCSKCGATKKQPHGPVIEMEKRLDTSSVSNSGVSVSHTLIAAVIPDRAADALRWVEEYKTLVRDAWALKKPEDN